MQIGGPVSVDVMTALFDAFNFVRVYIVVIYASEYDFTSRDAFYFC